MAKYDKGIREGELKNKVAADWFSAYDTTREVGNIDFCVSVRATELGIYGAESVMWAEAKAGTRNILPTAVTPCAKTTPPCPPTFCRMS